MQSSEERDIQRQKEAYEYTIRCTEEIEQELKQLRKKNNRRHIFNENYRSHHLSPSIEGFINHKDEIIYFSWKKDVNTKALRETYYGTDVLGEDINVTNSNC